MFGGSQREFAEQLETKPGTYAQWEAGNAQPRNLVPIAKRIEFLTRIPAAWMLGVMDPILPGDDSAPAGGAGAGGGSRDWTRTNNRPVICFRWSDGVAPRVVEPLRRAA